MRAQGIGISLALVLFAASVANAQTSNPQVTMGADIKLLRLDWEPVTDASYYLLRHRTSTGSAYLPLGDLIPASTTQVEVPIPVHLHNWWGGARYIVSACFDGGCTHSSPLNPRWLMLDMIGYLKASNSEREDAFGQGIALSGDGYTLAVSARFESSNATLVNGDQTNNLAPQSGAVYVFRRRGNTWHQEAYLKAGTNLGQQNFGTDFEQNFHAMALSADGSMLAVATPRSRAVVIFRRIQNVWSLMTTLQAPLPLVPDFSATSVDMSHDGRTLKVNSFLSQRTYIFVRPANTWQFATTLGPFDDREICQNSRLSGDGKTLVFTCAQQRFPFFTRLVTVKRIGDAWLKVTAQPISSYMPRQSIALNKDASVMALSMRLTTQASVATYRWIGTGWMGGDVSVDINTPVEMPVSTFGWELAFDDTGQLLAIGDPEAREQGAGIWPVVTPGTAPLGAVYLYQRNNDTDAWVLRNVVMSPRPGYHDRFGMSISLSGSGRTLAVGAPGENSSATGIDGERVNEDAPNAGAAYLY